MDYIQFAIQVNKNLDIATYWFRPSSGDLLETEARKFDPQRFTTAKVVIPPSDLCPEC
jgi:hypothetical protein